MTREKRKPKQRGDGRRWSQHPLYGRVPLIRHGTTVAGKTYEWWQCDPAYKPPLPRDAVEGDVSRQDFCTACHTPKYFYVDERHRCIQCGDDFMFTGREQKYWYETRRFNFCSVPIRCPRCRRRRRTEHALREQVAVARHAVESDAGDPAAHLALARAIVELQERTGTGRLEVAIAAARKAAKLWRGSVEAMTLEARARALRAASR
jgi:Probable zinc-ribbon domain